MKITKSTEPITIFNLRIPTSLYEYIRKLGNLEERSINWKMIQGLKEFAEKRGWKELK